MQGNVRSAWVVGLTLFLPAVSTLLLSVILIEITGVAPGSSAGDRIWSQPVMAVLGGITAVAAIGAGFLVASRTWRRRIRPVVAVALALIFAIGAVLGSLVLLKSNSTMDMPTVEPIFSASFTEMPDRYRIGSRWASRC